MENKEKEQYISLSNEGMQPNGTTSTHICGCGGACGSHSDSHAGSHRTDTRAAQEMKKKGYRDFSEGRRTFSLKAVSSYEANRQ